MDEKKLEQLIRIFLEVGRELIEILRSLDDFEEGEEDKLIIDEQLIEYSSEEAYLARSPWIHLDAGEIVCDLCSQRITVSCDWPEEMAVEYVEAFWRIHSHCCDEIVWEESS